MIINVLCSENKDMESVPRSFSLGEKTWEVEKVLDFWPDPDCRYFKVMDRDRSTFILRQDLNTGEWTLTFYEMF